MNQSKCPLYDALLEHIQKDPLSFHVPGHKFGQVFPPAAETYFRQLLKLDATELSDLDDLHAPEGPILEAETLLTTLYRVKKSFFLVNGSTSGNLTMILSACEEGQIVLVQRNCHKSILNALKLAKVQPVFLEPEFDTEWKVAKGVRLGTIREAIGLYPEAAALILTYPNYYGIAYDLKSMIDFAHQFDIPILVDEAHGPHFIIGEPFPPSAVQLGADIVVQSAHKTLPAMTMGAYLHFNSSLIDLKKVIEYLQVFQSSSPSYPIMASLDLARGYLATYNSRNLAYLIEEIKKFKYGLTEIPGIKVLEYSCQGDPLKVTIQSTCGMSGFALQKRLETEGVFAELADSSNVLLVLPLLKEDQFNPFYTALEKLKAALKNISNKPVKEFKPVYHHKISRLAVPYSEMHKLAVENVPVAEAVGRIAAEMVIPYPPGIPLLLQGEQITGDQLESLNKLMEDGAKFQGGSLLKKGRLAVYVPH